MTETATALPVAYDPVELRRRIVVCFSVSELQKLAEDLGVGGSIRWDRGLDEAARDLIRKAESYAGLETLVAKLREVRPLVEWPERAAPESFAVPPPMAPASEAAPALPVPDAYRPPPAASPAPFPGMEAPSNPAPKGGIDPRILVAVAGITLLAAVVAYLAGRASSGGQAAQPAADASAAPPTVERRPEGPATHAADVMARSLANVARVCEVPPGVTGAAIFDRVYERCGQSFVGPRLPMGARVVDTPRDPNPNEVDPADRERRDRDRDRDQDRPEPKGRKKGRDPGEREQPNPSKGCMGGCDSEHRACKDACGPEPTEGSRYDGYQQCMSRCLTTASRCRLNCH